MEEKKKMNPIVAALLPGLAFAGGYAVLTYIMRGHDYYIGILVGLVIFIARVVRLKMNTK